jgi:hypothetical protein
MADVLLNEKCVLTENEREKSLTLNELRKECVDFARNNFQGKKYINLNTEREIQVSRQGLGEWKMKSKTREQILSIRILDQILINAIFDHNAPDEKTRPNVDSFSYFYCRCNINNIQYKAIITTKRTKPYGDKYYHHYLESIKIEPCSGTAPILAD